MDKILKVGIIQQHNVADIDNNRARLREKMIQLAMSGAQLIVNQELHDSLYFCQVETVDNFDLAGSIDLESPVASFYSSVAREAGVVLVTSLFERRAAGLYHNTSLVFDSDGSLAGKYRKMHIPDDPA